MFQVKDYMRLILLKHSNPEKSKTLKSGQILLDYYATPLIHLVSYIMEVEDATLSCVHHRTLSLCTESLFSYAASPVISNAFSQKLEVSIAPNFRL